MPSPVNTSAYLIPNNVTFVATRPLLNGHSLVDVRQQNLVRNDIMKVNFVTNVN